MNLGQRHQMLRRKGKVPTKLSSRIAWNLDWAVYVVSMTGMLFTLDQVRLVWIDHNAAGVSFLTWAFYTVSSSVWCAYGYMHRERAVLVVNALWIFFNGTVALGVAIYGF